MREIEKEYSRLIEEMNKRGVSNCDIERVIGVKRVGTSRKLHAQHGARFSLEQAILIHDELFPDIAIEELFKR